LKAYGDTLPGKIEVKEYVGFNEAYADLAARRIVAVGNSLPNIAFVAKQKPDTFEVVLPTFGAKSYFGFIGRKDPEYASLMDAVDKAMLKIKADGRMATLQKKWFGQSFDTPDAVPTPNF
jgi:polar amino acid transport system substrate-binding protein